MWSKKIAATAILAVLSAPAVMAAAEDSPDWIKDTTGVGNSKNGIVRSDQILELGTMSSGGMQLEGENSLRMGNVDTALVALQKAVEMSPDDMDKRTLYAQALEQKLMKKKGEKDPALYNFTVKQWFYIYKKSEFIDQTLDARSHLVHLTGSTPKSFESAQKYLGRVLVPEDSSALASTKKAPAQ